MVYLVPFDGSPLSVAALRRAREFAEEGATELVVLSVVPADASYAAERGWVDAEDRFDPGVVAVRLESQVAEIAPEASFRWEVPEDAGTVASTTTDVVRTIRQVAHDVGAEVVFVGSENAGRVAAPVTSVGTPVSEDPSYDVFIVRHAE